MFGNQSRLTVTEHDGCGHSVSSVWCIAGEALQIASHRAAYGGELPQRLRFRTVSRVHEFLPQFNNPTENNSVPTRVGLPSSLSGSISAQFPSCRDGCPSAAVLLLVGLVIDESVWAKTLRRGRQPRAVGRRRRRQRVIGDEFLDQCCGRKPLRYGTRELIGSGGARVWVAFRHDRTTAWPFRAGAVAVHFGAPYRAGAFADH